MLKFCIRFTILIFFSSNTKATQQVLVNNHFKYYEEAESIRFNSEDVTSIIDLLISSKRLLPQFNTLDRWIEKRTEETEESVVIALKIFSLAINNRNNDAYLLFHKHINTFSNLEPYYIPSSKSDMLEFSYFYLFERSGRVIPNSLIMTYPKMFSNTTIFGSSFDVFFNLSLPKGLDVTLQDSYSKFTSSLHQIRNPGGNNQCWRGTREHQYNKKLKIATALILLKPEYYLENIVNNKNTSNNWLKLWKQSGPFENDLFTSLKASKYDTKLLLSKLLLSHSSLSDDEIELSVNYYLDSMEKLFIEGSVSRGIKKGVELYLNNGIEVILSNESIDGHLLLAISGDLLDKDDFINLGYLTSYLESHPVLLNEFINQASAHKNIDSLRLFREKHFIYDLTWGYFNKTPFMYAVQNDNQEAYQQLKSLIPIKRLLEKTENNDSSMWDGCFKPSIGNRTVLTYALENASKKLIDEVLKDTGKILTQVVDTANRNSFYYLSQNIKLTPQQKENIAAKLIKLNTQLDL